MSDPQAADSAAVPERDSAAALTPRRFAAFRSRDSAIYVTTAGLSMMADNIEHVITYWVLWNTFHSPLLTGFQVISHWLPFLFLSVPFGRLAERYDCRRIIQSAQLLFLLVSLAWGYLFLTGALQAWQACVLLVLHGCAGALWGPAEQVLLHDLVEEHELPSAVRLNATMRSFGVLAGPAVGAALLIGLGPAWGMFANMLFYLPMTVFLFFTRWTGHVRDGGVVAAPRAGFRDTLGVFREVGGDRQIVQMLVISGLGALFVGGAIQVAIPDMSQSYGADAAVTAYGVLLFANGLGAVVGGFLLEATRVVRPTTWTALWATIAFGVTILIFALTGSLVIAVLALVLSGVANIAALTAAQTVLQLRAPVAARGRVLGLSGMVGSGLRTGSGIIVAGLGAAFGLRGAVLASAVLLTIGAAITTGYALRSEHRDPHRS
ncbi:MFS transporter [Naasia lichenicola]|uniref:MFS transporter n=1 Tax=Naasia lichenicola TaxID=2565933 RepID=A0A4S4FQM6_9MICO|nr:MFS transporter [Naasia lichenicola]THG32903.1 MFS transporter [Naasia lichenicola]